MKALFRRIFNYYLVLKTCWFVLLFLALGFFSLVVFDQGQDILKSLSLTGSSEIVRQTVFVLFAVSWWSWQSFRSARVILHFSYFNFWSYRPSYSFRAQVFIPRLLASLPFFILAMAVYRANGASVTALFALLFSLGIWMFVLLHYRKSIIVKLRSWKEFLPNVIPDYIPIKNGAYPASFIWTKQRKWFLFRITLVVALFVGFYISPIHLSQYLGSATVVLMGFGSWLILASIVSFLEKLIRFPVSFSILLLVVASSFFNNNHEVETIGVSPIRSDLEAHFTQWANSRNAKADSTVAYLIMAEGGGLRSAYWTNGILNLLESRQANFHDNIYSYSTVSGGSLGVMMYETLNDYEQHKDLKMPGQYLREDLLAPITSSLIFRDLLQKFIPYPIKALDRSRILDKSFEQSLPDPLLWQKGFLENYAESEHPMIIMNTTHVESGRRMLVSNVDINGMKSSQIHDYFEVTGQDIKTSTAIGLSARFPFITPPAMIKDRKGNTYGNLVDGGYYENLGMQSMLDLYTILKKLSQKHGYRIQFRFIAIRNTKSQVDDKPLKGMVETLAPAQTYTNIWNNNSNEVLSNGKLLIEQNNDEIYVLRLEREDKENIPLGWYLSDDARNKLNGQLNSLSKLTIDRILKNP